MKTYNFSSIAYNVTYCWNICGYLKVIALLVVMQLGFSKFCCFLYEWGSSAKDHHYSVKEEPKCEQVQPGRKKRME
jgi:hypothetical protein